MMKIIAITTIPLSWNMPVACTAFIYLAEKNDINLSLWRMFVVWFVHENALALTLKLSLALFLSLSLSPYTPLYTAHHLQSRLTGVRLPGETHVQYSVALTAEQHGLSPAISSCRALECRVAARALPRGRSSMWSRSSGFDGGGLVTPLSLRLTLRRWETTSLGGEQAAAPGTDLQLAAISVRIQPV